MDRIAENEAGKGHAVGTRYCGPEAKAPSIILIGVQHTATTFFTQILEQVYGPYTPLKTPRGRFYYDHPWPHKAALIRSRMRGRTLVTTVRDKVATRESWVRRGVHELDDFHAQWEFWEKHILPHAVVLDVRDRECLGQLHIETDNDWTPVNVTRCRGYGQDGRRVAVD